MFRVVVKYGPFDTKEDAEAFQHYLRNVSYIEVPEKEVDTMPIIEDYNTRGIEY